MRGNPVAEEFPGTDVEKKRRVDTLSRPFLPAAKPSGPRTVRVVVVVVGVVGGSSLSGHNIAIDMKLLNFVSMNSLWGGMQIELFPFFSLENSFGNKS